MEIAVIFDRVEVLKSFRRTSEFGFKPNLNSTGKSDKLVSCDFDFALVAL